MRGAGGRQQVEVIGRPQSKIKELATVVLTRDIPERKLRQGDLGAVVLVHGDGKAHEVEFVTLGGETVALVALPPDAVRAVTGREIAHARAVA